jgi:hypothetical protein
VVSRFPAVVPGWRQLFKLYSAATLAIGVGATVLDSGGVPRSIVLIAVLVSVCLATALAASRRGHVRVSDDVGGVGGDAAGREELIAASELALFDLQNSQTPEERVSAFRRLLNFDGGWWDDDVSLRDFARAVAIAEMRTTFGPVAEDDVDCERLAEDILVRLFHEASSIKGSPREWLKSSAHALVVHKGQDAGATGVTREELDAIRALPNHLQIIAELWIVERQSSHTICRRLNITQATLGARLDAMRAALAKA